MAAGELKVGHTRLNEFGLNLRPVSTAELLKALNPGAPTGRFLLINAFKIVTHARLLELEIEHGCRI
jgi:hypothetical protein